MGWPGWTEVHAIDMFDEHGGYIGTWRKDMEDLNRCMHDCNCTYGEKLSSGQEVEPV